MDTQTQTITPLMSQHDTTPNPTNERCSERVYRSGVLSGRRCQSPAVVLRTEQQKKFQHVEVDDRDEYGPLKRTETVERAVSIERWYCSTHDPIRIAARHDRRRDQERRAWEARQQREQSARDAENVAMLKAKELVALLGCGAAQAQNGEPIVVLSEKMVHALVARLILGDRCRDERR